MPTAPVTAGTATRVNALRLPLCWLESPLLDAFDCCAPLDVARVRLDPLLRPDALRLDPLLRPDALRLDPLLRPDALRLDPLLRFDALRVEPLLRLDPLPLDPLLRVDPLLRFALLRLDPLRLDASAPLPLALLPDPLADPSAL
ncbi:MAG: hypothetical protein JO130_08005 [Solirubrobacterales bacterium]|nr:hypothetical protein [Solirubrobacterales bacterium]